MAAKKGFRSRHGRPVLVFRSTLLWLPKAMDMLVVTLDAVLILLEDREASEWCQKQLRT